MSFMQIGNWQPYDAGGCRKYLNAVEGPRFLLEADQLAPDRRAFCYVLVFAGCRVSEALELSIQRLDAERSTLTFRTLKRRKLVFRTVPIPKSLVAMLLALPSDEQGRWWPWHRVTAWRIIKSRMTLARIQGPQATCKGLRHAYGIRAAEKSIPPNLAQRWMGHASVTTTLLYQDAVGFEERAFAARMWSDSDDREGRRSVKFGADIRRRRGQKAGASVRQKRKKGAKE